MKITKSHSQKKMTCFFILILILFSFIPSAIGAIPASPSGFTAIAGTGEASFQWNPVADATWYVLYRATKNGGPYIFIAQTQESVHTDFGIVNGTPYYYVVTALNSDGQSPYSTQVNVTPPIATLSKSPADLTAIPGNGALSLAWDAAPSITTYSIMRADSVGGAYTLLAASVSGPGHTDTGLTNGKPYSYIVKVNTPSSSAYCMPVTVTPSTLLPKSPETLSADPGSAWASLSWTASPGALQYLVYRGTHTGGPYSFLASLDGTAYEDTGLPNGVQLYYVVAAVNTNGRGAFSSEAVAAISAVKKPYTPTLTGYPGDGSARLEWVTPSGALSFSVHRSTTSGGPYGHCTALGSQSRLYDDSGLSNGTTYYYVVDAHNSGPTVVRSNEVSITPLVPSLPASPTNIGVINGNTQVTVTWDPVPGASNYQVTVATSPGGPHYVPPWYDPLLSGGKPHFTVGGLTNTQPYYFRIQAINASNNYSAYSIEVSATPSASLPVAPSVSVISGKTQVSITWEAVDIATSYKVYRRTGTNAWPTTPVATPTGTLYTETGLTNGTTYYYAVAAVNETGTGAWSEISATPTPALPLAPTNIAVMPGDTEATITWDPVVEAADYYITVATSPGGPAIRWGLHSGGISHYTVTGLTNTQPYYFRVQALLSLFDWEWNQSPPASTFSSEVSAIPSEDLPVAPALSVVSGNTQSSIIWGAVDDATSYKIYRRTGTNAWPSAPIATLTGTLYTETGLTNGMTYYYAVAAVNETGTGAWSEISATPTPVVPLAPINVAVVPGNTEATVSWNPVVGASNYHISVATSPGGPSLGWTMSGGKSYYTVTGLTNTQPYYFSIQATNASGNSACSVEVNATPSASLPLAPTGISVVSGNTELSIQWTAVEGATGYKIYRSTTPGIPPNVINTPIGPFYTDTGLTNGTLYYYSISAINGNGEGAWSEITGTPDVNAPLAPSNVLTTAGDTQATITWDPIGEATDYQVTVATSPGGPGEFWMPTSGGNTYYTVTGLTNGQNYYFRVQTYNGSLWSAFSTEVDKIPDWPADTGNLSGHISVNIAGYNDLGVQNATVGLQGTGYSANTDANGNFTFVNVPFGDYQLVVEAPGMDTITQNVSFAEQNLQVDIPQMTLNQSDCIPGDVNGDGKLGLEDAMYILQIVTGVR
ncbi:MAG: fibronectin type III domain-containing protein [Desulfosalsimonadaceae bacterium]